jgi:beta-lactamase class D
MTYQENETNQAHRYSGNFYFEILRRALGNDELAAASLDVEYRAVERNGRTAYVIGDRQDFI